MNTISRRVRNLAWGILAPVFLVSAAGASAQSIYKEVHGAGAPAQSTYQEVPAAGTPAQSIYKEVDAAGHITYTNRPRPTPTPPPPVARSTADDVRDALAANTALSSRHAVTVDAKEAARRLRQAQQEREQGGNWQPGMQQGAQAGATVTDERYQRRQEKLRRVVEQARRRLNETRQTQR